MQQLAARRAVAVRATDLTVLHNGCRRRVIVASGRVLNFVEYAGDYELYSTDAFDREAIKKRTKILNDQDPHPFQRRKAETLARTLGDKTDTQLADIQRSLLASNVAAGKVVAIIASRDEFRPLAGGLGVRSGPTNLMRVDLRRPREDESRVVPLRYTCCTRGRSYRRRDPGQQGGGED
jgi:hypothetical protein